MVDNTLSSENRIIIECIISSSMVHVFIVFILSTRSLSIIISFYCIIFLFTIGKSPFMIGTSTINGPCSIQCGAPWIAKLVYSFNNGVYDTYNYSIHGVYKPTNIAGGAHIVSISNKGNYLRGTTHL